MALEERTRLPKLAVTPPLVLHKPPYPMTCEVPQDGGGECGKPVVAVQIRKLQRKDRVVASFCQECVLHMAAKSAEAAAEWAAALQEWAEQEAEQSGDPDVGPGGRQ